MSDLDAGDVLLVSRLEFGLDLAESLLHGKGSCAACVHVGDARRCDLDAIWAVLLLSGDLVILEHLAQDVFLLG